MASANNITARDQATPVSTTSGTFLYIAKCKTLDSFPLTQRVIHANIQYRLKRRMNVAREYVHWSNNGRPNGQKQKHSPGHFNQFTQTTKNHFGWIKKVVWTLEND